MDAARFGRALGIGTREAAKALLKAADAAAAPNPSGATNPLAGSRSAAEATPALQPLRSPRPAAATPGPDPAPRRGRVTTADLRRGGKRFGQAMWSPFIHLSGILWLEVTGAFFGIFTLTAGVELWRYREGLHVGGPPREHLAFSLGMLLLFGYFTISSFLRASRKSRRS